MALASSAFNRALAGEPWARDRLAAHAGRTFSVRVGPLNSDFRIGGDGALEAARHDQVPHLIVSLSPFDAPAFLANPARWNEFVTEEGDVELGGTLKDIARTLPWLVERLSARVLGPIVGQRIADAGRRMLELPEYAARRISANVGSYARDEVEVLAHPSDLQSLRDQSAALQSRTDALAARIDALEPQVLLPRADV